MQAFVGGLATKCVCTYGCGNKWCLPYLGTLLKYANSDAK